MYISRRHALKAVLAGGATAMLGGGCSRNGADLSHTLTDVAGLEDTDIAGILRPGSTEDIQQMLEASKSPVSIGGAGYSMGGQIVAPGSLHLDLRGMRGLIWLDVAARRVRVQCGMCWRDLQDLLDPHDLSVSIMQSYSNFSVGGSISVNCHGRYVGAGPIAHSIRAMRVVTADGTSVETSRTLRPELFSAIIGGYGGLGIVTEVELDLAMNSAMSQQVEFVDIEEYPAFFRERIASDPNAILHNADLVPPGFDRPLAISWIRTNAAPTVADRLVPRDLDYSRQQNLIWMASEFPVSGKLRDHYLTNRLIEEKPVVMRNYEASLDVASLEPRTRRFSTYLLQEYFIPEDAFHVFAGRMATVLRDSAANVLNVSIRHSPADVDSLLKWAPSPVYSFVIYFKQRSNARADGTTAHWTRQLIESALAVGGRYYLPYRLHASPGQFLRSYPEAGEFLRIKDEVDPGGRFRNRMWDKYLPHVRQGIA